MQAEKQARERKETACRQKSGHENERKPRAGRKAGTREKGNRVQAEKQARERKETACRQKSRHERKSGRSKIVGISVCLFYFCGGFISPYLPLYRKSASLELNADDFTLFWEPSVPHPKQICSISKPCLHFAFSVFLRFFYVRFGEFLFLYLHRKTGWGSHSIHRIWHQ